MATITPIFTERSDHATLEVSARSLFGTKAEKFYIVNCYSVWGSTATERRVSPLLALPSTALPTLVVGDFNIHHPSADPLRKHNSSELKASFPYFSRAPELGYILLNMPGVHTRFPLQGSARPSVLDLAFASSSLMPFFQEWTTELPSTGSDHVPITISITHLITAPPPPAPNWVRTDWPTLEPLLKETIVPPPPSLPTRHSLENWFDSHLNTLVALLKAHTPLRRFSIRAKPWWSLLLTTLRKEFHTSARKARASNDPQDRAVAKLSKQGYFKSIKAAKAQHWRSFLADATPRTIWTAKKFAIGRVTPRFPNLPDAASPEEMNTALLAHFFPPKPLPFVPSILRPHKGCDPLLPNEISAALRKCSFSSAPGPDTIPYSMWKRVHLTAPHILTDLLGALLKFGYHPPSLKKANGIVLDKPGKPSYDSPASFRVIVLLQTVSKILERVIASRLSLVARALKLVHHNQCGSLPVLSSFDAALSLVNTVRTLQRPGLKVSSLFLDIKGGFDNVNASILCSSLKKAGVPHYMVSWIGSFLSQRTCRLLFQGSPKTFSPVQVGTPQGSPNPPLLFVIYVASLYINLPNGLSLSYVDDFALSAASTSYRTNIRTLQRAFGRIKARATAREVGFSVPKTELIHGRTPLQRDPEGAPSPPPICLDGQIFPPLPCVRWLGYWFTPNLASSAHFSKRLGLAQGAFATVKRLSPPGSGLSPHLSHRLAISLLLPTLLYGADIMVPSRGMLTKMDVYWHQVQSWVSNCFRSTPIPILAAEACIPPLQAIIPHKRRMAALRLVCAAPTINPAAGRLCPSFPSLLKYRAPDSHRALCTRLPPNVMPLSWKTNRPPSKVRSHLPVDELTNLARPILGSLSFAPLANATLFPEQASLPPHDTMTNAYKALKGRTRLLLLEEWRRLAPPPLYYTFPLSLTPHPFMGLGKFIAGRIHQMRAQKSYLAAHPSWSSLDDPKHGPRCGEEDETFSHAILRCQSTFFHRDRLLQGLTSVGPDSLLWTTKDLLLAMAAFIRATATNYPPNMFPSLPPSPASMVFPSSPISRPVGLFSSFPIRAI